MQDIVNSLKPSSPYTAIVTGATGITGRAITKALAEDTKTWGTIYALSRSLREEYPSQVKHIAVDLLSSSEAIASTLKSVKPQYVFFTAYKEEADENALVKTNGGMLKNFLDALRISGAEKFVKRIILTVGAKQFGGHLGPVLVPIEDDDPRVEGEGIPPNFYYAQEDILKSASEGTNWDWVVTCPNYIIGFARGNYMNIGTSVALYAAITKELGEELWFPGSQRFYTCFDSHSHAKLIADFELWAALTPACSDQQFNVVNGDAPSWQRMWPKLAARFGCTIPSDQFIRPAPLPNRVALSGPSPLAAMAGSVGMEGIVPPGIVESRLSLVKWAERPEVKEAWKRMCARDGLDEKAFGHGTWSFADFVLGRNYDVVQSMTKARKLGWTGYVDTWEAYEEVFDELEVEKIIPKRE